VFFYFLLIIQHEFCSHLTRTAVSLFHSHASLFTVHFRLSYHYSNAHDHQEKEVFYKIKSAQKVLPLGYYDDVYTYLQSALTLTTKPEELAAIKDIVGRALFTIAATGPRSARAHRRPSLDSLRLSALPKNSEEECPLNNTPRTAAHIAELPSKLNQLEAYVVAKMEAVLKNDVNRNSEDI
jgi:hypothetical protein